MADFREDPIFLEFFVRWLALCLGVGFLFPSDVPIWVKALCFVVAVFALWGLPRTLLEMWRIARQPPGALTFPSFRRRGGKHASHD